MSAPPHPSRAASVFRDTKETKIQVSLCIDGGPLSDLPSIRQDQVNGERKNNHAFQESKSQYVDIDTGIGFLDHMLHALAKHAGWSLYLRCNGDLHSAYKSTALIPYISTTLSIGA